MTTTRESVLAQAQKPVLSMEPVRVPEFGGADAEKKMRAMLDAASAAKRDLTPDERTEYDNFAAQIAVIWIREMSGAERDAYEVGSSQDPEVTTNMRAKLIVRCACDETGALLFQPGDAAEVGKLSSVALDRLAGVADRVNVLSEKAMKAAMGKSVPSPGDEQSSPSP